MSLSTTECPSKPEGGPHDIEFATLMIQGHAMQKRLCFRCGLFDTFIDEESE